MSCDWFSPIMVSRDDVLTGGTKRQILAQNCKYFDCKGVKHDACR